ncbi:hypothetical protein E2C01_024610 [Portunus trituberculatus]|uniref:Uncharacterized protein n=1 Tax=Portunus trituberculatus TaxID=210409 RepID=A0A5B7EF96_PORTR|nr:hypothetical protein [Portunus trituberculatus]
MGLKASRSASVAVVRMTRCNLRSADTTNHTSPGSKCNGCFAEFTECEVPEGRRVDEGGLGCQEEAEEVNEKEDGRRKRP